MLYMNNHKRRNANGTKTYLILPAPTYKATKHINAIINSSDIVSVIII